MLDLALILELYERLHGLLDGRLAVETVHVVEIDKGEAQAAQALCAGLLAVLWRRVDGSAAVLLDHVGKLGRQEDVLALAGVLLEPCAEQVLVVHVPKESRMWALSQLAVKCNVVLWTGVEAHMSAESQNSSPAL